jgi:drug/metabolite transporter (DMT)-like permease
MNHPRLSIKATLLATLACLLWGSAFPAIKIGYQLFGIENATSMTKILFAGYRFTLAGLLILSIAFMMKLPFKGIKKQLKTVVMIAVTQTFFQYIFFYLGLSNTEAVKGSILVGTGVFFSMFASHLFFHDDAMTSRKFIGAGIGFLGIIVANFSLQNLNFNFTFNGEGFILLSTIISAIGSVLVKTLTKKVHPVVIAGVQMTMGGTLLLLFGLLGASPSDMVYSTKGTLMLGYLSVLSATAFSIWFYLLSHFQISSISIHKFQVPMWGALLSVLVIPGERFEVNKLFALILVITGIIIVNSKSKKIVTKDQ